MKTILSVFAVIFVAWLLFAKEEIPGEKFLIGCVVLASVVMFVSLVNPFGW